MRPTVRMPRLRKALAWRRNRRAGRRWDRSMPTWPERETHGRPFEGRARQEAERQRPPLLKGW